MKSKSGDSLRYELEELSSDLAIKLSQIVQKNPIYCQIADELKSPKTLLYFQKIIKAEIYSLVRDLCVIRWYKRNNKPLTVKQAMVVVSDPGIYWLLNQVWPADVALRYLKKERVSFSPKMMFRKLGRWLLNLWLKCNFSKSNFEDIKRGGPYIALQYVEGVNLDRRADIAWFPKSGIDPKRVLVYFDHVDYVTGKPLTEDAVKSVEAMGFKWICLKPRVIALKNIAVWLPPASHKKLQNSLKIKPQTPTDKWIYKQARQLSKEVDYWFAFYNLFNIRLSYLVGESSSQYIAQALALDLMGSLSIGRQRSEFFLSPPSLLGHHIKDILFTWNLRSPKYLDSGMKALCSNIHVGHPNDFLFKDKFKEGQDLKKELNLKGARFIVALFDNVHGPFCHISSGMMERFYLAFLTWLLEDPDIGIIIKSKKPSVLSNLPRVLSLLNRAEATGRSIRLERYFGRLVMDASAASDMVIGIGISSAVVESVIAGCRGIHCDLTPLRAHEYYQWGYERIIFDNLDRMMGALKKYKEDKISNARLGDWTPFLDELDPFRDGRAGERMGTYMRWLLEGFDAGFPRQSVLRGANAKYAEKWGDQNISVSKKRDEICVS
ncbi:MAG: hypothetical protein HQ596_07475 [Candidatus Saganbacteria bacterium]|nr:hypothetical protein [Candidatus Saganbacteria bacterium]